MALCTVGGNKSYRRKRGILPRGGGLAGWCCASDEHLFCREYRKPYDANRKLKMDSPESFSLPNLLFEVIDIFTELANRQCKERHPRDFHLRCAYFLTVFKYSLPSLCSQATISNADMIILDEVAVLLENLLDEKTVNTL